MGFDLLSELEKASMKYLKPAENQISSSNLEQFRAMVKLESSDSSEVENKDILEIGEQTLNNAQNYNFHQSPGNPYQISNFLNNFYINAPLNEAAQPQGAQYQLPPQLQQIQQIPQIQQSQQGQQLLVLQRLPLPFGPNQLSQHVQYRQPVPFPSQNPGQANMLQLAPGGNHYTNPYQQQPYAAPYIPYSNVPTMVDNTPAATTASTSNPLIARTQKTNKRQKPDGMRNKRTEFTKQQLGILESFYRKANYVKGPQRDEIAKIVGISPRSTTVWYQNRRARDRALAREENSYSANSDQ